MGGVNINVTTLQRETYFLKEFSDVWSGLQGIFAVSGFWPKSVQSGVYIYIYGVVYVVWCSILLCCFVVVLGSDFGTPQRSQIPAARLPQAVARVSARLQAL